jgi:ectoine hydroxylase-related dioxygenase (phytanoyl-CoA dioxygenase family)
VKLGPHEIDRYRELGFVCLGPLLGAGELEALRREEARFRLPFAYGPGGRGTLYVNVQLCHRSEAVRRVCTQGPWIEAVVQLLGPDVCLTHQQFVTKLPDVEAERAAGSEIPLHQDNGYGRLEPMTDVTVWVPLVDSDERNGGLWIAPRSQRLGLLEHSHDGANPLLRGAASEIELVPIALRAGEAVAFSGLTLHGSGPNRSPEPRPALFVRYCEPHVRMASEGGRAVLDDPHSWMVAGEARGERPGG